MCSGRSCVSFLMLSASAILISIGVVFLVITQQNHNNTCVFVGYPPLPQWVLGTGISFTIIGVSYIVVFVLSIFVFPDSIKNSDTLGFTEKIHWSIYLHSIVITAFFLAWLIVGCISLWRDGVVCANPYSQIWNTGMAGVIILLVFFGFLLLCGIGMLCGMCFSCYDYEMSGYD